MSSVGRESEAAAPPRLSLVDAAEQALRDWLAPGRYRAGDRLPPEYDVAQMLGISRGTLRSALARLVDSGEIVRRQGSGTFVGAVGVPTALGERLERLEPYSLSARRRGVQLTASQVRLERGPVGAEAGAHLKLDPQTPVMTIWRVLRAGGAPAAMMFAVPHPRVRLPRTDALQRALEGGGMVLDLLLDRGVPVGFAQTRVTPRLVEPGEAAGVALELERPTAALELEEVIYAGGGEPVAYARDLFAPGAIDVKVMRSLDAGDPKPIAGGSARRGRRTSRPA